MEEEQNATVEKPMVARKKLMYVIAHNTALTDACKRLMDHINQYPEIEEDLVKVFGITPPPGG